MHYIFIICDANKVKHKLIEFSPANKIKDSTNWYQVQFRRLPYRGGGMPRIRGCLYSLCIIFLECAFEWNNGIHNKYLSIIFRGIILFIEILLVRTILHAEQVDICRHQPFLDDLESIARPFIELHWHDFDLIYYCF